MSKIVEKLDTEPVQLLDDLSHDDLSETSKKKKLGTERGVFAK
jgi:hypothetical protein